MIEMMFLTDIKLETGEKENLHFNTIKSFLSQPFCNAFIRKINAKAKLHTEFL